MSKKTIAFTMPGSARRPRERAPVVLDAATGENVAFAADEESLRDVGPEWTSDEWVRDRAPRDASGPSPDAEAPMRARVAIGAGLTIDLAAERSLMEVMALSFAVPFALGWFWSAHALARRERMWGF